MTSINQIEDGYVWHEISAEVADDVKIRAKYSVRPNPSYYPEGLILVVELMDWPESTPKMVFPGGDPEECAKKLVLRAFEVGKELHLSNNKNQTEEDLLRSLREGTIRALYSDKQ